VADYPYIVDNVIHPVGDDWDSTVRINDADGNPKNLTGWVFWVTITKDLSWDDDEAYVHKSFTPIYPLSGEVTLAISADQLMIPGRYYRGIKVKSASGTRTTLVSGVFDLVSVPTKAL
jgi:hypothetical protein